ncbi:MAG: efflux RND transporter periplasmic adaptor subunit, partial [Spirochaetota bacterium]
MRKAPIVYANILFLLIFAAGCKDKSAPPKKVFPVKTMTIVPKSISSSITVMGTVDSLSHTWIIATAEGTIKELKVREGSYVTEGEVLCYIMPVESQNMISQAKVEYSRAKTALANADEASREEAGKSFREAELMLKSASTLYKSVPAVSSVSGTILSKSIDIGSYVSPKQNLIEVADLNRLIVRSAVSEDLVSKIRTGQKVKV